MKKKIKSPQSSRPASDQIPEPESGLDIIPTVDETLLKMIENQAGDLELSEETLNQFAPVEDFHDPGLLSVLDNKSIETSGKLWIIKLMFYKLEVLNSILNF